VLIILGLWAMSIYWFTTELGRVHDVNHTLWEQLLAAQKEHSALAWRCYKGEEPP
jgi:hypothetical protein